MPGLDDPTTDLDDLVRTIRRLEGRIDELEDQLAERDGAARPTDVLSRRALFGLAGAGIAGAAVGIGATPAAADTGDALVLGEPNTADQPTTLTSTSATGAGLTVQSTDTDNQDPAIQGRSTAEGAAGVHGEGTAILSIGVRGSSSAPFSYGVIAESPFIGCGGVGDVYGIAGHSDDGVAANLATETGVHLYLERGTHAGGALIGPPTDRFHPGMVSLDSNGDLFLCTGSESPGTWTKLNDQTTAERPPGPTFLPRPQRAFDSRPGRAPDPGGAAKGRFGRREVRIIDLTRATDVPSDATGVIVNATVTGTELAGYISLAPAGADLPTPPPFSTLNWTNSDETVANTTTVATTSGRIKVHADRLTHVVLDVIAYYA